MHSITLENSSHRHGDQFSHENRVRKSKQSMEIEVLIATKLAMKKAQLVNQEDVQIVSQIDNIVKIAKETTMTPFETIKVKGVIKAP